MTKSAIVKFKEFATYSTGQSPKSEFYSDSEGVPFLQGNKTFGHLFPSIETYTKKTTKMANEGDILMSVRAPVGDLNFAKEKVCIGRGIAGLTSKEGSNKFLYYCLKDNMQNLVKQGNGTTYEAVTEDIINDFLLIMPSKKEEREKVGKILFDLDSKIELNNKINNKLEALAKLIYEYWFVQFDFPDVNGKPYKSSAGKMVYNGELKYEIPKGWKVKSLRKNPYAEILKPKINKFEGEKIYLATADVKKSNINFNAEKIFFLERPSRANMQPLKYSVWFAKMKSSKKVLYFGDYSEIFLDNFILSTGFSGLRCQKKSLEYIWSFINNKRFEIVKDLLANASTQEAINNDSMEQIKLIIPDDNTLNQYHQITKSILKKMYTNSIENQKLEELKDWLLPMLMNGQVRVN